MREREQLNDQRNDQEVEVGDKYCGVVGNAEAILSPSKFGQRTITGTLIPFTDSACLSISLEIRS